MNSQTSDSACDDKATIVVVDHLLIRDGETGDVYVNQRGVDVAEINTPSE